MMSGEKAAKPLLWIVLSLALISATAQLASALWGFPGLVPLALFSTLLQVLGLGVWFATRPHRRSEQDMLATQGMQASMQAAREDATRVHEQLSDMSNALPLAIYHMENAPGGYRQFNFVSERTEAVLGVKAEEILRDPVVRWRNVNADDLRELTAYIERTTQDARDQGREPPAFEREFRLTRIGQERWVRVASLPVRVRPGGVSVWCGYYEDITERKRAELGLRKANAEQQAIFEAATVGIAFVRDGLIQTANPHLSALFGLDLADMLGQSIDQFIPPSGLPSIHSANIAQAISLGSTGQLDLEMQSAGGSTFWAQLSMRAVYPNDPKSGEIWIVQDITERHSAHDALIHAKRMAEDAAQSKADFLANMSHEIRTPMNAIMGMTHLALNTHLDAQQRNYVQKIQDSSQHLLGIINDILDFSKIESGKFTIEASDFSLDQLMDRVVDMIADKTRSKNLELLIANDDKVPEQLVGDELRIGQILLNYANNAVKFTETGEISMATELVDRDGDNVMLRFSVTDTGIGLSEDQTRRLFQSFSQADASTTRKYGGTGLGLAISKSLAGLMGGEVGVRSELGKGSCFWFTARLQARARSERPSRAKISLEGLNAWVIDDNASAREVLSHMLNKLGLNVRDFPDGAKALAAMQKIASVQEDAPALPQIVLVDWAMPGLDGVQTLEGLRSLAPQPQPTWVMVSAFPRDEVLKQVRGLDVRHILTKPVSASMVLDMLMRTMGTSSHQEPSESHHLNLAKSSSDALVQFKKAIAGTRVLLVEDNEINQEVATALLQEVGCEVAVASNGLIAVNMVKGMRFDLVLMDMQMPVMDGVSATRRIREMVGFDNLPIIAMTANVLTQDRVRCLDAGMIDFVGKPIEPVKLWQTLAKWCPAAGQVDAASLSQQANESPPQDFVALPQSSPALNVEQGLARMMGNRSMYVSILRRFLLGQTDAAKNIRWALAQMDFELAVRLAHTAKGLAGNVGAEPIWKAAAALEQAVNSALSAGELDALLESFEQALCALQQELSTFLNMPAKNEGALEVESAINLWPEIYTQLEQLLRDDDPDAVDYFAKNSSLIQQIIPEKKYRAIQTALESYDLDTARSALKETQNAAN